MSVSIISGIVGFLSHLSEKILPATMLASIHGSGRTQSCVYSVSATVDCKIGFGKEKSTVW